MKEWPRRRWETVWGSVGFIQSTSPQVWVRQHVRLQLLREFRDILLVDTIEITFGVDASGDDRGAEEVAVLRPRGDKHHLDLRALVQVRHLKMKFSGRSVHERE